MQICLLCLHRGDGKRIKDEDKEIIALIAYLQRMGTDIKKGNTAEAIR